MRDMMNIINASVYGSSDYKEGKSTDGLYFYINKRYTIEEIRERLKEAHVNATDEMVQTMFDEIIKTQTERESNNDSLIK